VNNLLINLKSPAYRLVAETAQKNWSLIVINLSTNLLSALLEGSTLAVIFLAVSCLTEENSSAKEDSPHSVVAEQVLSALPVSAEQRFLVLIFGAVLLQALLSLSNYFNKVATASLSAKAQPYVTGTIFERIMTFSYDCASRYKVGDLVLFSNDAAIAVDRQIGFFNDIAVGLSFSVVYLVVIVRLSSALAIASTFLTLVVTLIQFKLLPRLRKVVRRVTDTQVESAKYITENIQALRLLHTFGTQQDAVNTANGLLSKTQQQLQKRAFLFYLAEPILDIVPILALAVLAASAVVFQVNQSTILPMLLTFLLALQRLSTRLKSVATTATRFADESARMLRLDSILSRQNKLFELSGDQSFVGLCNDILFERVSLSYANDEAFALENLTFTIPRNQVTALVGESGAGKSSIADLLVGLYQPTSGSILVNGSRLEDYCLPEWRRAIGVVSQDTFIFNDSILENLRYGRPETSLDDVIEAAKASQAHAFISMLPKGYDTVVGERGYRLSGGQRQRLALARALIKQPEILILDEATSALDSESEKLIQQALAQFQSGRTVIVVAHRLSTIVNADQILVLEKGQVVEQGTHRSLLQQYGRYARYWALQSSTVTV
jgi:ATP-binding cassette, subfamily B, bacterial MsbA